MVTVAEITAGIAIAQAIFDAIVKAYPAIQKGVVSSVPFVEAIAGLIAGSNATQEQIDQALANVNAVTDEFLKPLPPDDGNTTT